jgi:hypothetical protein
MTRAKDRWKKTKRLKRLMYRPPDTEFGRECGGCTGCCTVMAVPELHKGMYRTCSHVSGQGCSIYPERPRSCRSWSCQWRLGEIDGARPEQSGIVVNLGFRRGPHYEVYELWEGAASHPLVLMVLENLPLPVYVFEYASQGRSAKQLQDLGTFTNNCMFGHGTTDARIGLPLLPPGACCLSEATSARATTSGCSPLVADLP